MEMVLFFIGLFICFILILIKVHKVQKLNELKNDKKIIDVTKKVSELLEKIKSPFLVKKFGFDFYNFSFHGSSITDILDRLNNIKKSDFHFSEKSYKEWMNIKEKLSSHENTQSYIDDLMKEIKDTDKTIIKTQKQIEKLILENKDLVELIAKKNHGSKYKREYDRKSRDSDNDLLILAALLLYTSSEDRENNYSSSSRRNDDSYSSGGYSSSDSGSSWSSSSSDSGWSGGGGDSSGGGSSSDW